MPKGVKQMESPQKSQISLPSASQTGASTSYPDNALDELRLDASGTKGELEAISQLTYA
jgi:hypothetical protein